MTQPERFDAEQFAAALKRVGVPALKADTYAHDLGLLASEVPEAVQCFRDVILRLADVHATMEARLVQAEALVETLTLQASLMAGLVLPTPKPEAKAWPAVDVESAYLGSYSVCSGQRATSTESEAGDQLQQHHMHRN